MRTDKQNIASKINGSKSKGPTTEAGKQKSANNATSHGLSGSGPIVLLENESEDLFNAYRHAFLTRFRPIDLVESELVEQMLASTWRLRRMEAAETAIMDLEIDEQRAKVEEDFDYIDNDTRNGLAFRELAERSNSLDLLTRYRTQARRMFTSALKSLQLLQGSRFNNNGPIDPDQPVFTPVDRPAVDGTASVSESDATPPEQTTPSARSTHKLCFARKTTPIQRTPNEPEIAWQTFTTAGTA